MRTWNNARCGSRSCRRALSPQQAKVSRVTATSSASSALALARTALFALAVTLLPQESGRADRRESEDHAEDPWAVGVVAVALWPIVRYPARPEPPSNIAATRREAPRAVLVARPVLFWAWLAGACALIALVGCWIVLASWSACPAACCRRSPATHGGPLPSRSGPARRSRRCVNRSACGAIGVALEQRYSGPAAIVVTAIAFALLPHPPAPRRYGPNGCSFFDRPDVLDGGLLE